MRRVLTIRIMAVCTAANILGSIIFALVAIGLFPSTAVAFVRFLWL